MVIEIMYENISQREKEIAYCSVGVDFLKINPLDQRKVKVSNQSKKSGIMERECGRNKTYSDLKLYLLLTKPV